jgi:S-adenosylmethionine:diacylglycerol 3-amino-3-carboxypropyl transferase/phosphohistidine swiveling domain-containing protein
MKLILTGSDPKLGGKARALAELQRAGFPVLPWFVISPDAYPNCPPELPQLGELVAVRSSASEEDGVAHSYAGQLESFLNVSPADVPARVVDVWQSGFSERIQAYRHEHGLTGQPPVPAVLVQRMVNADTAGVAFSADPVSGRRGIAVVSAVAGLGDKLVSGECNADTFTVDRAGNVTGQGVLTTDQARAVAELARRAARHFGRPQDIEWAFERGQLWLLQSRPITSLAGMADPDGELRIWDNSNITESYSGVTTPLTYTFARHAYEGVYREFCRLMAVPAARIEANDQIFGGMIGLIRGRVYYHLLNWYRLLALLPGFTVNRRFMEQMMGVKEGLPDALVAELSQAGFGARLADALHLTRTVAGLVANHFLLPRRIRQFYERLNHALAPVPLEDMRPDELAAHYRDLERRLLTHWDAPLINDFFAMIFHGLLRKLTPQHNELLCDAGGMISAEPVTRIRELAALSSPELLTKLRAASLEEILPAMPAQFRKQYDAYLDKFGDRCLDELKLESPTLRDDPLPLLRSVAAMAGRAQKGAPTRVKTSGGLYFRWVLRNAKARVRDRENLRFERTRLFGRIRRIFVELGRRFHALDLLADPRDIFYLELDEVIGFIEGTATTTNLKALVALRQAPGTGEPPAERFETRGIVNHGNVFQPVTPTAPATGAERTGLGCCPGIVRGPVRVVRDPRAATLRPGEILVAERTDPGWVMIFPAASGLLVERGSLLSHSAIVARELGLPAIVAIPGLTRWLKDGDEVEMDGGRGVVRRICTTEIAKRAEFSAIRYAQCWEDADVLLAALDVRPGDVCLSIASAGDNSLALLTRQPAQVLAVDLNPAQLACLELRVAAYRCLDHAGLLELIGSTPSHRRVELYQCCRGALSPDTRRFWDACDIAEGIGGAGKFERYFTLFRNRVLPLVHSRRRVEQLLTGGAARREFYATHWDTWRWRLLFQVFFSRFVMGRLGRDPSFFQYVEGSVADRIMERARYALTELDPADNPYLQWILTGRHATALPFALRKENFDAIRTNLDRLEWRCAAIEDVLAERNFDRFNLSDIFEYMSPANYEQLLERLAQAGKPGGRLVYWNMLAPRQRPERLADRLRSLPAESLFRQDKAFFYRALIIEEVIG